jgi:hypothetical protein
MFASIALLTLLAFFLVIAGYALVRYRGRGRRDPWHLLRDLSPVSVQWLADRRRSG